MSATFRVGSLIAVVFIGAVLGFWAQDRDIPVQLVSAQVLTPVITPGDPLKVRREVLRTRQCKTQIDRVFTDSTGTRFVIADEDYAVFGKIGVDNYISQVNTPAGMAPGPASYQAVARFTCNPLQSLWPITREAAAIPFTVAGAY